MDIQTPALFAMTALAMAAAPALGAEIKVMSGGAPQEAFVVLVPQFEKATGHKLSFTYAVITELQKRLEAGATADIVFMPVPVIDKFVQDGKLSGEGRGVLGRVRVVVIAREGISKPDLSTPEKFRDALLAAKSIVHATPGQTPSGTHMGKVMEQLGIADAVKDKSIYRPALDGGVDLVEKGEADLGIYPASEVTHIKRATLVGPLPEALQLNLVYGAAVTASNPSPGPARDFIKFLTDPGRAKVWTDAGFEQAR